MSQKRSRIVGIDLGTSYSCVATVVDGRAAVIPDRQGRLVHPSIVYFPPQGEPVVGDDARPFLATDPTNTVYSFKRLIGREFNSGPVRIARNACPYEIAAGPNGFAVVRTRSGEYSVPELSGFVLRHLKRIAEDYLQAPVEQAVITVPANFNDPARQSTRIAGRIAGLEVLRIVNEPTAAALAFGFGMRLHETLIIYDFGGGTFDVTVLEVDDPIFRVLATAGDPFLGGDDFDMAIANAVAADFKKDSGVDLRRQASEWPRLVLAAEQAKRELSKTERSTIHVPGATTGRDLRREITRDELNVWCADLVQRSFEICDAALADARMSSAMVEGVVMVGGSTHVPLVRASAEQYFGRHIRGGVDPELAVALGAAIHAAALTGEIASAKDAAPEPLLLDVVPASIGIAAAGGFVERILSRGTPVPIEQKRAFATSRDGQTDVKILVYQGEGKRIEDCVRLGELVVKGLRAAPRGQIEIEVTFEVDTEGILNVTARDLDSGRVHSQRVRISGELTDEQVDRLFERHSKPPP